MCVRPRINGYYCKTVVCHEGVGRGKGEVVEHSKRVSTKMLQMGVSHYHSERSSFQIMKDCLAAKRYPAGTVTKCIWALWVKQ